MCAHDNPQASCNKAQETAHAATIDGCQGSKLARVGSRGKHPQNCLRDCIRQAWARLGHRWYLYPVKTVGRHLGRNHIQEVDLPVLLPHDFLDLLWSVDEHRFRELMGSDGGLRDFWKQTLDRNPAWFRRHPARQIVEMQPHRVIPVRLFGDDASIAKTGKRKLLVQFWIPWLGGHLPTRCSRIPMLLMNYDTSIDGITELNLMRVLVWSWQACFEGIHPSVDYEGKPFTDRKRASKAGQPICGGYRAVFAGMANDWKYTFECFHLPWNYNADQICHLCVADTSNGPHCFTNFALDAPCSSIQHDEVAYLQSACGRMSPYTSLVGFSLQGLFPECMHCGCLGTHLLAAGSALKELANSGHWGRHADITTWKERLAVQLGAAFQEFKEWCSDKRISSRQKTFTPARLSLKNKHDKPELKTKAHCALVVVEWLADVCSRQAMVVGGEYNGTRAATLWSLAEMFRVMRSSSKRLHLLPPEAAELQHLRDMFFRCYCKMRGMSEEADSAAWAITPKFHMLDHAIRMGLEWNVSPATWWTFKEEDGMGLMLKICKGGHALKIEASGFHRWLIQFFESMG